MGVHMISRCFSYMSQPQLCRLAQSFALSVGDSPHGILVSEPSAHTCPRFPRFSLMTRWTSCFAIALSTSSSVNRQKLTALVRYLGVCACWEEAFPWEVVPAALPPPPRSRLTRQASVFCLMLCLLLCSHKTGRRHLYHIHDRKTVLVARVSSRWVLLRVQDT